MFQKTDESVTAVADIPVEANSTYATGDCNSTKQTIVLHFFGNWELVLSFGRNETEDEYHMTYASLSYDMKPGQLPFSDAAPYANRSGLFDVCYLVNYHVERVELKIVPYH